MPSKSPRPSRETVRSAILQTARTIAATDGWSSVTVRKVAERIGYTAPIIYEHFGSKDEMLNQILKGGYESLYAQVVEEVEKHQDSGDRIAGIIAAFWDFSHTHPELYQLMYGMEGARATSEQAREYALPLTTYATKELIQFDPERINSESVVTYMMETWSMVHGMIALDISGYTTRYVTDRQKLLRILTADVLYILRRQETQGML